MERCHRIARYLSSRPVAAGVRRSPPRLLHRFSQKEREKERRGRGKKTHRERKQLLTITRATAHGSNPPREYNRDRTVTERSKNSLSRFHPVENIARDRYIVCRGIFLHRGFCPIIFPLRPDTIFSFLFFLFYSQPRVVPSSVKKIFFCSLKVWMFVVVWISFSSRKRERKKKGVDFWKSKGNNINDISRNKTKKNSVKQRIKVCLKKWRELTCKLNNFQLLRIHGFKRSTSRDNVACNIF